MTNSKNTYHNILTDALPDTWRGVKIKTDYRQVLKFFMVVKDKELTDEERAFIILNLFFNEIPAYNSDVWEFIQHYVNCGKEAKDDDCSPKVMDFEVDAGRIYSAFYQAYGVDLAFTQMHWFTFFELFQCLPGNTRFMEIIELRGKKTTKNDSPEYKRELRKLQDLYRIEDDKPKSMKGFFDTWKGR